MLADRIRMSSGGSKERKIEFITTFDEKYSQVNNPRELYYKIDDGSGILIPKSSFVIYSSGDTFQIVVADRMGLAWSARATIKNDRGVVIGEALATSCDWDYNSEIISLTGDLLVEIHYSGSGGVIACPN